mgnify:CR=1 FL=1
MDSLTELIQRVVKNVIRETTMLSSVPCFVTEVIGNEKYKVKTISTNDIYILPNFSGSSLAVGENVKIYYQGSTISPHSAYIGASLTKKDSVGEDVVYLTGISNPAQLQSEEKIFAYVSLEATRNTTVTFSFNANFEGEQGDDYLFKFFVNDIEYDYYAKGSVLSGNCQVVLPISLTQGESTILVKGIGSGTVEKMMIFASGQGIKEHEVKVRELTGTSPLSFVSNGDDLLDWRIRGASGGVGKIGINYLKQTERTMPDGTYGKRVYQTNSWISSRYGTFNSGQATTIGFNFHKSDNGTITPSDVGKIYIAEGDADPETEGDELDIFQGGVTAKGDYDLQYWVFRYGDDGSGETVIYNNADTSYIPIRCGTAIYKLKPDTNYSFVRVGGDSDIEIQYTTAKDSADLRINWELVQRLNSIPGNSPPDKNIEQWTVVSGYNHYSTSFAGADSLDSRPAIYDFCAYYADLKAGHYKVVCECYKCTSNWGKSHIYGDQTPYMVLINEDNIQIIPKTQIFQGNEKWYHEEYEFTLTTDTKVGLYFKAINKYGYNNVVRFGIFDYDTPTEEFTVRDGQGTLSGVTCWQPFRVTLPLIIQWGEQSQNVEIDLGTSLLGENDVIGYSDTGTHIPTYSGMNTIYVNTENKPSEMYIKYKG